MVTCGICKNIKEVKNKWIVREHSVGNEIMREFRLCDGCATSLIRKFADKLDNVQKEGEKVILTHNTLIHGFALTEDNELEIVLPMDLAKARKIVLEETGEY
jgi:hypothetical protein